MNNSNNSNGQPEYVINYTPNYVNLQSNSQSYLDQTNLIKETITLFKQLDIKLIAFDFDCTLVNIHTGGQWLDSAEKLAQFVRPCFRDLLPLLLKTNDIHTCVVTYSPQEKLIKEVLKISMKDENDINSLVDRIVIKGNTKEFIEEHGLEACYTNGKQLHLEYCKRQLPLYIKESSILLIDDDVNNLKVALENGHYAFHVANNVRLIDLNNYLRNQLNGSY
ncbi:unnamed protein product [Brachionus calyciflorus]|uniref:Uncharacterized protein n=1 Tax=Brachionus calyciflorus TaxID=104777 RepID=A0A814CMB3_9BILA|nr:unnamed protein product [Brachionus calyciflorus]